MGVRDPITGKFGEPVKTGAHVGRPKGARAVLGEAFLRAVRDDFEAHGVQALKDARVKDPSAYIRMIASLQPKEVTGEDGGPVRTSVVYRWATDEDPPGEAPSDD